MRFRSVSRYGSFSRYALVIAVCARIQATVSVLPRLSIHRYGSAMAVPW
jgi:hypothetical protein